MFGHYLSGLLELNYKAPSKELARRYSYGSYATVGLQLLSTVLCLVVSSAVGCRYWVYQPCWTIDYASTSNKVGNNGIACLNDSTSVCSVTGVVASGCRTSARVCQDRNAWLSVVYASPAGKVCICLSLLFYLNFLIAFSVSPWCAETPAHRMRWRYRAPASRRPPRHRKTRWCVLRTRPASSGNNRE